MPPPSAPVVPSPPLPGPRPGGGSTFEPDPEAIRALQAHYLALATRRIAEGHPIDRYLIAVLCDVNGRLQQRVGLTRAMLAQSGLAPSVVPTAGLTSFEPLARECLREPSVLHDEVVRVTGFAPNAFVELSEISAVPGAVLDRDGSGRIDGYDFAQHPRRVELLSIAVHVRGSTVGVLHLIEPGPPRRIVPTLQPQPGWRPVETP